MKVFFIALVFGLFFSTDADAKKVSITATWGGIVNELVEEQNCRYSCAATYSAHFDVFYHVRDGNTLALNLLYGDVVDPIASWTFTTTQNGSRSLCVGSFYVPRGNDWTLVWVLTTDKDKVVDAIERLSGTCPPILP